jgi:plastocyanin
VGQIAIRSAGRRRAASVSARAALALLGLITVGNPASAEVPATEVTLGMHAFDPDRIVVHPGDRIAFHNRDDTLHSVVLVDHDDVLPERFIDLEETFVFQVPADLQPGDYPLACTVHVEMRGRLVVVPP